MHKTDPCLAPRFGCFKNRNSESPRASIPYRGLCLPGVKFSQAQVPGVRSRPGRWRPDSRGADAGAGAGPGDEDGCQDGSGSGRTPTFPSTRPPAREPRPRHPHGPKSQHAGLGGSYRAVGSQVRPPPAASWRLGTFSVSPPPPKCVAQRRFHHLLHLTPATLLTEGGVNPMRLWLERRAPRSPAQPIIQIPLCLPPFFIFKKSFRKHFRLTRKLRNQYPELLYFSPYLIFHNHSIIIEARRLMLIQY